MANAKAKLTKTYVDKIEPPAEGNCFGPIGSCVENHDIPGPERAKLFGISVNCIHPISRTKIDDSK